MGKKLTPIKGGALAMSTYTHKVEASNKNLLERFNNVALNHPESSGDELAPNNNQVIESGNED
eukprot:CAMPEP_0116871488 /NCGR_PEP_ID=MMETSP0463-20121206/1862_1 /TAXON_ID=181622 /ORGANISM="Strombidinopsis sp, Strain SopsisLIS2011" /LENGTH=62 /DNA_ID=CAMNT_0004510007 /DNA_START=898 /DNA_END=1086 /DNA_ORIENTATION=-